MVEDGSRDFGNKNSGERVPSQEGIDNLLGFTVGDVNLDDNSGIRAGNRRWYPYERLPMLEIIFDRLVRLITTCLRNCASDNVEVWLDRIASVRFGDCLPNWIPPRRARRVQGQGVGESGLTTVNPASSIRSSTCCWATAAPRHAAIEGRPYTAIETNLVKRLVEVVLAEHEAFPPCRRWTFDVNKLNQSALRRHLPARQCRDPGAAAHRHGSHGSNMNCCYRYATFEPIRPCCYRYSGRKIGRETNSGKAISRPRRFRPGSRSRQPGLYEAEAIRSKPT